ncbi:Pkinase-domain-containing protein [Diplogelasinospora grovesii]|uniref:Pkinase-domain-containing protein n=1 Tax=Diplogelasinospora grovesii TaxID=303347 RepID=A0AAN6S466_9PEZI|nr:Pkinase-domain-containing protein [Diplogelasinospora grovesii]
MTTVGLEPSPMSVSSPDISIEFHGDPEARPASFPQLSAPADMQHFKSPLRQHRRTPSAHREVKETLNARSEYTSDDSDGRSHHRINQYVIKEEIGRGSFGAVHLATDQFGNEYAVKEFSKARLRKRAQSNILRHGPRGPRPFGRFPPRAGFGSPDLVDTRMSAQDDKEAKDALFLIREEIAIMKKLNHPNLVQLIEVLDDPEEDSLYMVLEMCKKGVIMKVGINEQADPYPEESCRCWFRDLMLGIEYLHSQGVVHRDIKPDNLLLTDDDVLKVVDFGVSEMFEKTHDMKTHDMRTSKSAGSPAFLPPELCVAKHGDVSGKAADIWSMGVSLYCLKYGRIPFERSGVLEMFEAIKTETPKMPDDENEQFMDLMKKLMERDPDKRITMAELRACTPLESEHPWVTKGGEDPLLSFEENCSDPVDAANALEVNHALTRKMTHLVCVMKAVTKFKSLLAPKGVVSLPRQPIPRSKPETEEKEKEKEEAEDEEATPRPSLSSEQRGRELSDAEKSTAEHAARVLMARERFFLLKKTGSVGGDGRGSGDSHGSVEEGEGEKGHAHDPTDVDPIYLGIGTGDMDDFSRHRPPPADQDIVSDSPTAVDFNIYDRAFEDELERIKRSSSRKGSQRKGTGTGTGTGGLALYPTKHLDKETVVDQNYKTDDSGGGGERGGRERGEGDSTPRAASAGERQPRTQTRFADLVEKAAMLQQDRVEALKEEGEKNQQQE